MKIVIIALAVSSFSLVLAVFGDYNGSTANIVAAIIAGLLFWLFLILGYVLLAMISKHRKQYEKKAVDSSGNRTKNAENKKKPGIICFFSNQYALISDVAMGISFILTLVVLLLIPKTPQILQLLLISLTVFSIHMHCVLNGINFKYIRELSKKS